MIDLLCQTPDICFPHNKEIWTMKLLTYECFLGMLNSLEIYVKRKLGMEKLFGTIK